MVCSLTLWDAWVPGASQDSSKSRGFVGPIYSCQLRGNWAPEGTQGPRIVRFSERGESQPGGT